jgi:N-acetylglutamate synthase-like GNAT family acetyltransferase
VWDAPKAAIVGGAPEGIFAIGRSNSGDVLPGEWWRVEDGSGVVGYGWMEYTWGDAEILLAVAPERRDRGVGTFILDQLEQEAGARGLNYLYNVVRPTHPERQAVSDWLTSRGFVASHDDDRLMRRVRYPRK